MFDIIFPISNNSEIKLRIPISRLKLNLEFELDTSTNKKVGAAKDHGEKATFFNSPPSFAWESVGRFKSRNLTNQIPLSHQSWTMIPEQRKYDQGSRNRKNKKSTEQNL